MKITFSNTTLAGVDIIDDLLPFLGQAAFGGPIGIKFSIF